LDCRKKADRSALPARRKIPSVYYSDFLSTFGFFGGRSFFAAALAEAASPVFAEEASLPFCGAASFVFGAVAGGSTGCGSAVPLSTRTFSVVVTSGCKRSSTGLAATTGDYIPHHAFFQYHAKTANPMHTRPASISEIGNNGPANHNYDINDFFAAVTGGNFPAVSFLKSISIQDGHAGYSDPLDEQTFVVNVINFLQRTPYWSNTAVVIMYDDSDGWYDHQMSPIVNQSTSPADALTGPGACGDGSTALSGPDPALNPHAQGRCGYGPRLPLLVVSSWAKRNFVDHTVTDQTSIIRFVEDNWLGGKRIGGGSFDSLANSIEQMFDFSAEHEPLGPLFLNPGTGQPSDN